jgi:hypothetical protein
MRRIDLGELLKALANLGIMTERIVRPLDVLPGNDTLWISLSEMGSSIVRDLKTVGDAAEALNLPATGDAVRTFRSTLGRLTATKSSYGSFELTRSLVADFRRDCDHVATGLRRELVKHQTFVVPPAEVRLLDDAIEHFGQEVITAFPGVRNDVISAAKCQAFELWTASVMHTMRVAEAGVGAFADYLTVQRGKTWGGTIQEVLKALDDAKGNKGQPALQVRLSSDPSFKQWASEVASYLNFVKDAFRNPAMHPDLTFDRDQAIAVCDNARAFMRALVKRLADGGQAP